MINAKNIFYIIKLICEHHTIIGKGFDLLQNIPRICNKVCTPIAKYFADNQPKF
jgi:hypothetical protein